MTLNFPMHGICSHSISHSIPLGTCEKALVNIEHHMSTQLV